MLRYGGGGGGDGGGGNAKKINFIKLCRLELLKRIPYGIAMKVFRYQGKSLGMHQSVSSLCVFCAVDRRK